MVARSVERKAVVLVVEDDALLRMSAVDMVEDAGFTCLEAANASEAIEILEHRRDIRIVFTDVDMPGSMDGIRLAACIRDRWPPIEIIVTSGYFSNDQVELPTRGLFFPKPYDQRQVIAAMHRMVP